MSACSAFVERLPVNLTLSGVSFRYASSPKPIFSGIGAVFPPGWTGIVGANGCGKSTLAKIACGILSPDSGAVAPPNLFCAYCPQEPMIAPGDLQGFADDYSAAARAIRGRLNIEDDMPWRFDELSCGEQKKIQIACALVKRPDVLVLDEPTNHVDTPCRRQIAKLLSGYEGIGLLISHDRALLNALAERCLICEAGLWTMRPGSYEQASGQGELERQSALDSQAKLRAEAKRLKDESTKRAQKAARTDARRSARNLDKHDSDGRAKIRLAIISGQDGKAGALASSMSERASRAQQAAQSIVVPKRYRGDLWIDSAPASRKVLVRMPAATISCGPAASLALPGLFVGNVSHIAVTGANGQGKSTLVRHLVACVPDDVDLLYIPQELGDKGVSSLQEEFSSLDPQACGQVLSLVAQLGSDAKSLLESELPSPGLARKLMLVLGLLHKPELIVMDEPTNHMDLPSIEALQRALAACPVALVLVSHDADLLEECCDEFWNVEAWRVPL